MTLQAPQPLARVRSVKVKLGLLVAASSVVAAVVATVGDAGGVPVWLGLPVTVALALALTQLLAVGMTSPLRQMTEAARRMATGDYRARVTATSSDEVGELARAFNTMAQDLDGVDRQRRALVANVSHELRTPLAALRAVLENLADGVVAADTATLAAPLAQAERLSQLVEDLLDLARVDAGKAPLSPGPVDVRALLEETVAEPRPGREVSYAVDVVPADLVVHADPARLRQLVANLLDNAARHSPPGGVVAVTARRVGDGYRLEVHDAGPGVGAADRERAFEPFGTLDAAAGDGEGGTGLGLAIARWVTDLHGGRIGFVDPPSGTTGARVRVDLPQHPIDRPRPHQEDPVPSALPPPPPLSVDTPPVDAPVVTPQPLLDDVFGAFWPDGGVPARLGVLLGSLGVGVLGGLVLPERDLGLGTFLVLLGAGGVVLGAAKHRRDPFTMTCAVLCALLALTTLVRDAEWVAVLSMLAGAALCVCGVTRGRSVGGFVMAGVSWPLAGLRGLPWLGRTLARLTGLGHGAALLRTAVWSGLGLVVFGALFASADALVAEWVDAVLPDLTVDTVVLRVFVSVFVGGTVLAAAYLALDPPRVDRDARPARAVAHRFEWLAPVAVVNAVFLVFLAAQATVAFGGHDYLERTTGITYADYVHQGFGQLTFATVLTLVVVAVAGRKATRTTPADRLWLRGTLGLLCAQTLVVVASALYRMHVYQEAYGFTRLRLLVDVFEGWLGVLVVAVVVSGIGRAAWLARFALVSGCVALLGIAAINPDAWIADRNLDRYAETGKVDWTYLRNLSDDAVPTILERPLLERQCALLFHEPTEGDWLEYNLGRSRAADALREYAYPSTQPTCPGDVLASSVD